MILPSHKLDQIDYYTHEIENDCGVVTDKVRVYWKPALICHRFIFLRWTSQRRRDPLYLSGRRNRIKEDGDLFTYKMLPNIYALTTQLWAWAEGRQIIDDAEQAIRDLLQS